MTIGRDGMPPAPDEPAGESRDEAPLVAPAESQVKVTPDAPAEFPDDRAEAIADVLLDGRQHALDPRWPDQERVGLRLFLYVLVPTLVGVNALWVRPGGWWIAVFIVSPWPLAECFVRVGMAYVRRAYLRTAWRVSDELLEIRRGVWWRTVVSVPLSRVQHTDVTQGPVQRRFGLATLVVHTAGTQHATVTLEGLEKSVADAVRDHLLQQRGDDAV